MRAVFVIVLVIKNHKEKMVRKLITINGWLVMVLLIASCSTVGDVMPISPTTYTVASQKGGQFWTLGPSWSDVKALSINRANEFCTEQKKQMEVVGWETHGVRGFSQLNAELTFKCI